jgi:hypothetical protein
MMRGKISVVSELSKGTVFIIEIPVDAEYPKSHFIKKPTARLESSTYVLDPFKNTEL